MASILKLSIHIIIYFLLYLPHWLSMTKKMWKRQIVPYFDIHETKMLGPFKMNGHKFR